jgi:hypothetical protein
MSEETSTDQVDNNDDTTACIIRGKVTCVRGPAPLASVTIGELIATTDITGSYQFNNLKPAKYEVKVTPPEGWEYKAPPQAVELEPGQVKVVDFYLEKVIQEAILEGYVWDGNGTRTKDAVLTGVLCGSEIKSATTDEKGYFIFKNVNPGNRFIRVSLAGHIGETRDFTIPAQQKISMEFHLKKAAHKLYGSVVNAAGKPVSVSLQLFKNSIVIQKIQTTPENGNFEFPVEDGEYALLAQAQYYELAAWSGTVAEDVKVELKLSPLGRSGVQYHESLVTDNENDAGLVK